MSADPKQRHWCVGQRPGGDWGVKAIDRSTGRIVLWGYYKRAQQARDTARSLNGPIPSASSV